MSEQSIEWEDIEDTENYLEEELQWRLSKEHQHLPREPREFVRLMVDCFAWPTPKFFPASHKLRSIARDIDRRWDSIVDALWDINHILKSDHDYQHLTTLLEDRYPANDDEQSGKMVASVEAILPICATRRRWPQRRKQLPGGRGVHNQYERSVVRAIFWYFLHVEGREPTISFEVESGAPNSQASIICSIVLDVLKLGKRSSLRNHMRAVKGEKAWRDPRYSWWDNLPTCGRSS